MSNKRTMYRPVVCDSTKNTGKRPTLSQGRLVTQSTHTSASPHEDTAANIRSESYPQANLSKSQAATHNLSARRDLSGLMESQRIYTEQELMAEGSRSPSGFNTPRKHQPQLFIDHHSPIRMSPPKPSKELDLTDSEQELSDTEPSGAKSKTVDVSGSMYRTERSNVYGEDSSALRNPHTSAVFVDRHTDPVYSDLRNTGYVEHARKVPAVKLNSISITSEPEISYRASTPELPPDTSTLQDTRPKAQKQQVFTLASSPETDESISTAKEKKPAKVEKVKEKKVSVDKKSKQKMKAKADASVMSIPQETSITTSMTTKKKKPPKVVQSRYMSSIETPKASASKKGPMRATDVSVMGKAGRSHHERLHVSSKTTSAMKPRKVATKSGSSTQLRSERDKATMSSSTPELQRKKYAKSSTPASRDVSLQPGSLHDVSAISHINGKTDRHMHSSIFSTPSLEGSTIDSALHHMKDPKGVRAMDHTHLSDISSAGSLEHTGHISKRTVECVQNQLTNTYCRYLQWAYLDSKAKKAAQVQEKAVMEQLYALSLECSALQSEKAAKRQELRQLKHLNTLDEVLDMQHKALEPICDKLPEVEKQYKMLSSAIDTTRHQLPIRGIYIPTEEKEHITALEESLEESEQLLSELYRLSRSHAPTANSYNNSLYALRSTAEQEVNLLGKVHELVSATQTLITQESSLLIQDMACH